MKPISKNITHLYTTLVRSCVVLCLVMVALFSQAQAPQSMPDSIALPQPRTVHPIDAQADSLVQSFTQTIDSAQLEVPVDSSLVATEAPAVPATQATFNPDGMRAVWLSALCPGLGQIYNRRYWKLPIVVGGFVGLAYATSWNDRMYSDYQQAYLDIMDTDPSTNSYMDFFPSYYDEDDIDKSWLTNLLKTRKDTYRHYRDYCVVGMVALYLVCILDAYVDAEMFHFDMSTDLSLQVKPAIIPLSLTQQPALGMQCAITF